MPNRSAAPREAAVIRYVACADHLDWGYVDHPPLIAAIVAATRSVLGDSLPALRFPALLAGPRLS